MTGYLIKTENGLRRTKMNDKQIKPKRIGINELSYPIQIVFFIQWGGMILYCLIFIIGLLIGLFGGN